MSLFKSFESEAREAAETVEKQFPGSRFTVSVDGKVVTLTGEAPDVETKRRIMEVFTRTLPEAENVVNNLRAERPGQAASAGAPGVAAGSPTPSAPAATATRAAVSGGTQSAVAEPPARLYVVKRGDTLSAIAREYYGNAGKYMKIFEANRDILTDPNQIRPGQNLRIPD